MYPKINIIDSFRNCLSVVHENGPFCGAERTRGTQMKISLRNAVLQFRLCTSLVYILCRIKPIQINTNCTCDTKFIKSILCSRCAADSENIYSVEGKVGYTIEEY